MRPAQPQGGDNRSQERDVRESVPVGIGSLERRFRRVVVRQSGVFQGRAPRLLDVQHGKQLRRRERRFKNGGVHLSEPGGLVDAGEPVLQDFLVRVERTRTVVSEERLLDERGFVREMVGKRRARYVPVKGSDGNLLRVPRRRKESRLQGFRLKGLGARRRFRNPYGISDKPFHADFLGRQVKFRRRRLPAFVRNGGMNRLRFGNQTVERVGIQTPDANSSAVRNGLRGRKVPKSGTHLEIEGGKNLPEGRRLVSRGSEKRGFRTESIAIQVPTVLLPGKPLRQPVVKSRSFR